MKMDNFHGGAHSEGWQGRQANSVHKIDPHVCAPEKDRL